MHLEPSDGLRFQRDGFLIVRDVLRSDEVASLRASIQREADVARSLGHVLKPFGGECVPVGDIMGREGLGHLLFDERILKIARLILGRDDIVYFGDSGLMVGGYGRGFHKDNTCRDDATHADWTTPYSLIRFGFYLEDHDRFSGGVKVRRGSHLHADVNSGAIVDVPTRAGDAVVWSLRTTHSGHAIRVRGLPFVRLQPRFEARLPQFLRVPEPCERHAVFITYGADDEHLKGYIDKHRNLADYPDNYIYKSWLYSAAGPSFDARAAAAGIRLIRPVPDYGTFFGSKTPAPLGYIPTGRSKPDHYEATGVEAVIRAAGKVVRSLGA